MNPNAAAIPGSLIREIAAKRKPSSIDLGLGEPSLAPNALHLEAGMRYAREHGLRYTVNAGDPELRAAIAAHYGYDRLRHAENVCITTGSQEAAYAVIKTLLDPVRDELLVVDPVFPSYAKMAKLEGVPVRSAVMSPSDGFAFDPERILGALTEATRMIAICSPCNPTARVMTREAMERLVQGLQQRAGDPVWILHDEIYREQTYVDDPGYAAAIYPHTIVTNSVSKSNALTGLRLGWAMAPSDVCGAIVKVHAWVTSCADSFAQAVARSIFSTPDGISEHAAWYRERRQAVIALLERSGLPFIAPDGSFYACIQLPPGASSLRAAHRLADEHDVIAIPGVAFGDGLEGWLRISWVAPIESVQTGIERIAGYCASG